MGCRNKINTILIFICCVGCLFTLSCQKKHDVDAIQTKTWIMQEFGEKTTILSLSPIPVTQNNHQYWRVSLLLDQAKRWDGLVWFSADQKKYEIIEMKLPPAEGK